MIRKAALKKYKPGQCLWFGILDALMYEGRGITPAKDIPERLGVTRQAWEQQVDKYCKKRYGPAPCVESVEEATWDVEAPPLVLKRSTCPVKFLGTVEEMLGVQLFT